MAEKRRINYPKTRAAPKSTRRRKRGDPTRVAQRIAKYQQRGLSATEALRELRRRGGVGMRTDRFYALYSEVRQSDEFRRQIREGKSRYGGVLHTETRSGWNYWVRVYMINGEGNIRDMAVSVATRRRVSSRRAVEAAMARAAAMADRSRISSEMFGYRPFWGYVIVWYKLEIGQRGGRR